MCLGGYRKLVVSNHIPISITTGDVLYAKWHAESGVEFAGSLNGTKVVNRYMGSRLLFFSPLGFDHDKCFTVYEVDGLDVCWAVIRDESFITMHHVPLYTIYQLYDRV